MDSRIEEWGRVTKQVGFDRANSSSHSSSILRRAQFDAVLKSVAKPDTNAFDTNDARAPGSDHFDSRSADEAQIGQALRGRRACGDAAYMGALTRP